SMEAAASSIWLLFFLLEYETQFTLTALDWLNFNSDNYPARGGYSITLSIASSMTANARLSGEQRNTIFPQTT
ncbi:hypothetical protein, partial [Vibrio navarrensis]|uniref:hypothetical protein n=1 Tax=Vibrio navarrensis TaxID=29495 RepID=UPI001D0452BE